ncbi:MAG: oligosaccharide flippase family protein [bacterium]|nr:oligosaccharide flippase family protein [bacterium]
MFYWLATAVPLLFLSHSFSGALEAAQRFDLLNAVKVPLRVLSFLIPLLGLTMGCQLPGIIGLMVLTTCVALAVLVLMSIRAIPELRRPAFRSDLMPRLFAFGGWITISGIVNPLLTYLDRFLVASLLGVAAMAYYTAPHEAATRILFIPGGLATALTPAFSTLLGSGDHQVGEEVFARSVKYILLAVGPIALTLGLFADDILRLWLGAEFASRGAVVLMIVSIGVFMNSVAHVPHALLLGRGRPDIPAKFHVLELPVHVLAAWALIHRWGVTGAAAAWTFRVTLDASLLFLAAGRIFGLKRGLTLARKVAFPGIALLLLAGGAYVTTSLTGAYSLVVQSVAFGTLLVAFAWFAWNAILDTRDRTAVATAFGQLRASRRKM